MNSNFISEPKQLISDSLQDMLSPDDAVQAYREMFISALLNSDVDECSVIGTLLGIEFAKNPKIDIKISLEDAFSLITNGLAKTEEVLFNNIVLALNDKVTKIEGPFGIVNAKIIDFDANSKLCVLAIDLIKKSKESP